MVAATVGAAILSFLGAAILMLAALFGRSIHGPPPPAIVHVVPWLAAALAAWLAFEVTGRVAERFARRRRGGGSQS